jgi:hypothetical protein
MTHAPTLQHDAPSPTSIEALRRLAETELSERARLAHVALLLVTLTMSVVVGSLWATEPALPARAQVSFALMTAIGLSWAAFATWVLTARRVLLARHRIVAGRMAVAFTGAFVAGSVIVALTTTMTAAWVAAGIGAAMLAVATSLLVRARHQIARLNERRAALERELARPAR